MAPPRYGIGMADAAGQFAPLPARLRAGLERLSGVDLSSVRVHYDSPHPASIQAAAFTRGQDIHLAPGGDRHLAHEGWHAVQQLEGRVRPTGRIGGVPANDDAALEREADGNGRDALAGRARTAP